MNASPINTLGPGVTPGGSWQRGAFQWITMLLLALGLVGAPALLAQTGGEGGIQGSVLDPTGAIVSGATVTATNVATGLAISRKTTSDGLYSISPIIPGKYTVTATAQGFATVKQENLNVNALTMTGLNLTLQVGTAATEVTVTTAPPQLDTTNATMGLTVENETYSNLPLQMNGGMRDPTAFGALAPGAQGGTRLPIIGGTGNYLGQLYLDGLPAETVSQQGDNRLVSDAVSVDAVDQFQVVTSTPPAEYSGAGAENFTMKSGGLKYHGQISDFVRNTAFDAWSFTAKAATVKNALGQSLPAPKPAEHQNELSASFGGHVPHVKRLFFFVAYDKYAETKGITPALYTDPSTLETQGDFTELNGNVGMGGETGVAGDPSNGGKNPAFLFNPTTTTCNASGCSRQPFEGLKNGIPTYNVIPSNYISPIAQKMESFLPAPSNPLSLSNNYLGGQPSGYNNHVIDYRVDFDLSPKNRLSTIGAIGAVNYLNNYAAPFLPLPYTGGDLANVYPHDFDVEDAYTISNSVVNQFKYGYTGFYQNIHDATQGVTPYEASTLGITNLPPNGAQSAVEFPGVSFATTAAFGTAIQTWTTNGNSTATQITIPNNFTLLDNLQWVKGKHNLTFGIQVQWQEINNANPATYTGILQLPFNAYSTANFSGSALSTGTATMPSGYSYASFLLGAVGGTPSIGLDPVAEVGGRYKPISPYVEDNWKISQKLTLDIGLRWDYLPPYHEVKDRWSFLNATQTNAATGTPGDLQFAGNYGGAGVSCGCATPVQTYWKNFGPRAGLIYQADSKTIFRVGAGHVFSQGGGVGGRGGAYNGTGQTGFNVTATGPAEVTTGAGAGPSFYLNNSTAFQSAGLSNTSLFGPGYTYPTPPTLGPASQILNTGNYLNSAGKFVTASGVSYADPYFSGRAPDFTFYNAGFQRALTSNLTLAVDYVGNESHHLENSTNGGVGSPRGYWSNQLNPIYLAGLGGVTDTTGKIPILIAPATAANVAKAQAAMPGISIPAFFQAAAAVNASATITQGLVAFPQYSGVTDTWGQNVGNFSYNSLQVTLQQRLSKGLTFNFNYTWSSNLGDDGTFRSGFNIPAGAISREPGRSVHMDRIERSWTTVEAAQLVHTFGVYKLPFGRGEIGGDHFLVRALAGGWRLSGIYTYSSGTPAQVTWNGCTSSNYPGQGQCMPDINPNFTASSARINGGFGRGPNGRTTCNLGIGTGCTAVPYFNSAGFTPPVSVSPLTGSPVYLLGNAGRTAPLRLWNPGSQDVDTALKRDFSLPKQMAFIFEVDCLNTWNHTVFSAPNASYGSASFGTISGIANSPRDFQFAGHITF